MRHCPRFFFFFAQYTSSLSHHRSHAVPVRRRRLNRAWSSSPVRPLQCFSLLGHGGSPSGCRTRHTQNPAPCCAHFQHDPTVTVRHHAEALVPPRPPSHRYPRNRRSYGHRCPSRPSHHHYDQHRYPRYCPHGQTQSLRRSFHRSPPCGCDTSRHQWWQSTRPFIYVCCCHRVRVNVARVHDSRYYLRYSTTTYDSRIYTLQTNSNGPATAIYVVNDQYYQDYPRTTNEDHLGYPAMTYNNGQYTSPTAS
ncbi:hypothetical protein V8E55_001174 [Tylopilus felleus]